MKRNIFICMLIVVASLLYAQEIPSESQRDSISFVDKHGNDKGHEIVVSMVFEIPNFNTQTSSFLLASCNLGFGNYQTLLKED